MKRLSATHGTRSRYTNYRCRCDACRAANAHYVAAVRLRYASLDVPEESHGRYSTYIEYACRCEPCKAAASETKRRSARKAAS